MPVSIFSASRRLRAQVVKHGGVCYLSGMVAAKAPGASVAEQTKSILTDIEEMLASAGTSKAHLLTGWPGLITPWLSGSSINLGPLDHPPRTPWTHCIPTKTRQQLAWDPLIFGEVRDFWPSLSYHPCGRLAIAIKLDVISVRTVAS